MPLGIELCELALALFFHIMLASRIVDFQNQAEGSEHAAAAQGYDPNEQRRLE